MTDDASTTLVLEKIKYYSTKPNENIDSLRQMVARLNTRAACQDKSTRDKALEILCRKQSGNLAFLLNLLGEVRDTAVACHLASVIRECVSSKPGIRRNPAVSQLVHANGSRTLVKLIVEHAKEGRQVAVDPLLNELIHILSPLALKDAKFSIKARLLGSVKVFCSLLKSSINHSKLILPTLQITKSLARNVHTTSLLIKNGVLTSIEKIISTNGVQPSMKFRISLDILNHISKNKVCCVRITKTSLIYHLLRVIENADKYEGKTRVKICKPVLLTLQHLSATRGGRKYIKDNNGTASLYKFCSTVSEEKFNDTLLSKVCGVINLCLENKEFPLENLASPLVFHLPPVQSSNELLHRMNSGGSFDDSGDDSPDEDDEDGEGLINTDTSLKEDTDIILPQRIQRVHEELNQYQAFFQELSEGSTTQTFSKSQSLDVISKSKKDNIDQLYSFDCLHKECYPYQSNWCQPQSSKSFSSNKCKCPSIDGDLHHKVKEVKSATDKMKENLLQGVVTLCDVHTNKFRTAYSIIASRTKSIIPFVKVAYPEMIGGEGSSRLEALNIKDRTVCRSKLLTCVERGLNPSGLLHNVVYDLDDLIKHQKETLRELTNLDETKLGEKDASVSHLKFESRFECGNLRKVIQIGPLEYNLILTPDVNSSKHLQWFYFEVSNMEANKPYVFNIINCEKQNSQFNFGMKPLMFSVQDAVRGQPRWNRVGTDICYYRNSYQNPVNKGRTFVTTTFTITFPHQYDVCYIAYHYPYSYSLLMTHIWKLAKQVDLSSTFVKIDTLCKSLNNNPVPLLTITAQEKEKSRISEREIIVLTARVHPGECNSSWVMGGVLSFLMGNTSKANDLRKKFLFKIVPMLNPEGVINGCDRCGLTDEDLNRCWIRPNQYLHPVIYHTKGMVEYLVRILGRTPYLYCDFHGHSRRKNVFIYGCSREHSWYEPDRSITEDPVDFLMVPHLIDRFNAAFNLSSCNFRVEKVRESTARVTFWREFGVKRSYTMESSYCGMDQGTLSGFHINTTHLKDVGLSFCEALLCAGDDAGWRLTLVLDQPEVDTGSAPPYPWSTARLIDYPISRLSDDVTKSLGSG